jgi:hypothetical protein
MAQVGQSHRSRAGAFGSTHNSWLLRQIHPSKERLIAGVALKAPEQSVSLEPVQPRFSSTNSWFRKLRSSQFEILFTVDLYPVRKGLVDLP